MNTKKKTIKNLLSVSTCLALTVGASVGVMGFNKTEQHVDAVNSVQQNLTNANFNENTSSSYPYAPSGYDAFNGSTKTPDIESNNVSAGVINLSDNKYATKFSEAKRTNYDDYVLMIDSSYEEEIDGVKTTKSHAVNFGFRTSSTLNLKANAHYAFTVDVFASVNSGIGDLFLYDEEGKTLGSIVGINSYNNWSTYTFFVSTNDKAKNVTLGMYLHGDGSLLFDNLSWNEINEKTLNSRMSALQTKSYTYVNDLDNIIEDYHVNNNKFVNASSTNTASIKVVGYENGKDSAEYTSSALTSADSNGINSSALFVENFKKTYIQYETDEFLTFKKLGVYKVAVSVKTTELDGNVNLQLVQTGVEKEDEQNSEIIKITSNTDDDSVKNGYVDYCFYVYSHPTETTTYKLVFGLGDKDTLTTGKMYVGGIRVTKINYNDYTDASAGETAQKIDLTSSKTYKNNSLMLDNANFNAVEIEDYNQPLPAKPKDWNVTTGNGTQHYGVVNTSNESFATLNSLNMSNLSNPFGTANKNENVLMMYNESANTLSYTSTTKSVGKNSYSKFEIDVQTQNSPVKLALVSTINNEEVELTSLTIETGVGDWQTAVLYLKTANQPLDVALKITLESSGYAYVYVDNAKYNFPQAPTETEFNNVAKTELTVSQDLNNWFVGDSNEQWANPIFFAKDQLTNLPFVGIIDINKEDLLTKVLANEEYEQVFKSANSNVVGIRSAYDVAYTLTSKLGFNLTADEYYKISVDVYTQNIGTNKSVESNTIGAGIALTNFDNIFSAITSNNAWTTYTFYLKPTESVTTCLQLMLGNRDVTTKGDAFFGNIKFETIDESTFNAVTETSTVKLLTEVKEEEPEEETETDTEETEEPATNNNWIYYIPSILFVVAIVVAIVGVMLRKIKWKKPHKKSKNEYDRNKTVSRQFYMRKATTLRENKLRELNKDLETLKAERNKYEEGYKESLAQLRQMKIKRVNPTEIAKFEKQMKKDQKMSSSIGMTINKVESDIAYTKTDAYLNALAKKLARVNTENEEEKESK